MMMNDPRQKILGIIQSLDTGSLVKMLETQGIKIDHSAQDIGTGSIAGQLAGDGEKLESWNNLRLDVPQTKNAPIFDKNKVIKGVEQQVAAQGQQMRPGPQQPPEYLTNPPSEHMQQLLSGQTQGL